MSRKEALEYWVLLAVLLAGTVALAVMRAVIN